MKEISCTKHSTFPSQTEDILLNSVLGTNMTFRWSSGHRTVCIHDFTMTYMTATRALTAEIQLSLSEILPVNG